MKLFESHEREFEMPFEWFSIFTGYVISVEMYAVVNHDLKRPYKRLTSTSNRSLFESCGLQ